MSLRENKAIVKRSFDELWNHGNTTIVDELVSRNYVRHDPAVPQDVHGRRELKDLVSTFRTAFSDLNYTLEDMTAEGDEVTARYTIEGTHDGELMGIPATNKHFKIPAIVMHRISNGKLVEDWAEYDQMEMMQQLGIVPSTEKLAEMSAERSMSMQSQTRSNITTVNKDLMRLFSLSDASSMASLFTEDAQIAPPNAKLVIGRQAIQAFWQNLMDRDITSMTLETAELETCGSKAIEQAHYTLFDSNNQMLDKGKYMSLWKLEGNQWRPHRNIFNSNMPLKK